MICAAREMKAVKELIECFADVDVPCLVTGETGTGKELVAQALHESSVRSAHPFVEINCGALSDTLIESELFGHKRGAFTGAQAAHPGLFREAGAGTIFLDEIGDISPKLQMALLRVLETGEARAVGGSETYKINCRIIAATNADLARRVEEGRFRADLMYRLERLQIHLPPLRERPDDIVILAEHFLNLRRVEGRMAVLLPRLKARFRDYHWPGNVRERAT
jgi:two-component system response regulator HydG